MTEAERDQMYLEMDDVVEVLDGSVFEPFEFERFMRDLIPLMRQVWNEERQLLWVARGMNDGDEAFTVSAEWR